MSTAAVPNLKPQIVYPDSDGKPMAENTLQWQWIVTIVTGLDHLFAGNPDVFVAGDLFWYPVEGHPEINAAPDAMVAFGRPKGHRPSYMQWAEGGVAPQVVFEVLSPGNRAGEMVRKLNFYRRYGVEEYYLYDPDPERPELTGLVRQGDELVEVDPLHGHVSPRLGVRFEMGPDGLRLLAPDGRPFRTPGAILAQEEQERRRADREGERADRERERADQADRRAEQAVREAEELRQRLRSLGQTEDR